MLCGHVSNDGSVGSAWTYMLLSRLRWPYHAIHMLDLRALVSKHGQ